ncbi:S24 family peptidase [Acetobacter sp.]|uniref:S24 family peptidase n=1 Tax=Acetobacter sp. TaxID=440 RepID=UPI0039E83E5D
MTSEGKKPTDADFAVASANREIDSANERLRAAVRNAGGNQHVANVSGVPLGTLNTYIAGREMRASTAAKIAAACGVSLDWLISGSDAASSSANADERPDSTNIDFLNYDVQLSAGSGVYPSRETIKKTVSIPRDILPKDVLEHEKYVCALTVKGDSMQPSLDDGDLVLIRTDVESIKSGAIYAIRIDHSLLVKRLRLKANGNVEVVSDNPSYSTDELKASEIRQMIHDGGAPAKIIGRVVWRSGAMTV